jgi:hypothetical protein
MQTLPAHPIVHTMSTTSQRLLRMHHKLDSARLPFLKRFQRTRDGSQTARDNFNAIRL